MNEKIRELAEQAKGFVDLNQHVGGEKGCMVYTYEGLERFAESIIQECVETLGTCEDYWTHEHKMTALKRHFGVEE
jgi:hypothetical protein